VQLVGREIEQGLVLPAFHPVDQLPVEDRVGLADAAQEQLGEVRETACREDAHVPRALRHHARDVLPELETPSRGGLRSDEGVHEDGDERRNRALAQHRVDRAQERVIDRRLPREREVEAALHALLEDAVAERLVQRVLRGHVFEHLVERLGVVLHHALDRPADAHADGRHTVERERVHVVVRDHYECVGLLLDEAVAHARDGVHCRDDLLPPDVAARRLVVVGIEHV
jgi:hypothetical protein